MMFYELRTFSVTEVLVLSAIARNHEIIENSNYKKSFTQQLTSMLVDIDKINERQWNPINDLAQAQMLACDLRFRIEYSFINIGIKINSDHIDELWEYLVQNEYDICVRNNVPNQLYYDTSEAITRVAAVVGLVRIQKMFREILEP